MATQTFVGARIARPFKNESNPFVFGRPMVAPTMFVSLILSVRSHNKRTDKLSFACEKH